MHCPFCHCIDTQVKNSRPAEDGAAIRRRRECPECGSRFTTFERIKFGDIMVIKKSGDSVPFDREKIAQSIYMALRKRPFNQESIEKFISSVVQKLEKQGDAEIATRVIGQTVLEGLFDFDKVGYVRFASVYKDFQNPDDFKNFVASLAEE